MTPFVSIVIPTLNGGRTLERLLDSIAAQASRCETEVVAVDSGSTDGTLDWLRRYGARVLPIARETFNHGESRNVALTHARGTLAVLIVQDAVPAGDTWLDSLVAPMLDDPGLAGTFARQQPWPDASRLTAHYLSRWVASDPSPRTLALTAAAFEALSPAERHAACAFDNVCSCIRMSVWRAHPFRPTPIAEDLEWAKEVLLAGHRLAYVPSAVVWHSHERPVRYELHRTYRVHQRLQALFGLSTIPSVAALFGALGRTLPVHLRLAAGERDRRLRAVLRGAGLAVALPLGQYLGARAARDGRDWLDTPGV
jgi:rhamnosyltransferase